MEHMKIPYDPDKDPGDVTKFSTSLIMDGRDR